MLAFLIIATLVLPSASVEQEGDCTEDDGNYWNGARCADCPKGWFATEYSIGSTGVWEVHESKCRQCPLGKYADDWATSKECKSCQSGRFGDTLEALSCKLCPAGKSSSMSSAPSASMCETCASGKFSEAGAASCETCASGKFSEAGASSCKSCAAGKYLDSSTCKTCATGKFSEAGAASSSACKCKQGTYASGNDCALCATGTFSDMLGATSCKECSSETFSGAGMPLCSPMSDCTATFCQSQSEQCGPDETSVPHVVMGSKLREGCCGCLDTGHPLYYLAHKGECAKGAEHDFQTTSSVQECATNCLEKRDSGHPEILGFVTGHDKPGVTSFRCFCETVESHPHEKCGELDYVNHYSRYNFFDPNDNYVDYTKTHLGECDRNGAGWELRVEEGDASVEKCADACRGRVLEKGPVLGFIWKPSYCYCEANAPHPNALCEQDTSDWVRYDFARPPTVQSSSTACAASCGSYDTAFAYDDVTRKCWCKSHYDAAESCADPTTGATYEILRSPSMCVPDCSADTFASNLVQWNAEDGSSKQQRACLRGEDICNGESQDFVYATNEKCIALTCDEGQIPDGQGGCGCLANFYLDGDACQACPSGSESSAGSTSKDQCQCSASASMTSEGCQCDNGKYMFAKSNGGDNKCYSCPAEAEWDSTKIDHTACVCPENNILWLGANTRQEGHGLDVVCQCDSGFTKINGACVACPYGGTKTKWFENRVGVEECTCSGVTGGAIAKINADGNAVVCACPANTYFNEHTIHCHNCMGGTVSEEGSVGSTSCVCPSGQEMVIDQCVAKCGDKETRDDQNVCVCKPNFYSSGDACVACPTDAESPLGSTDLSQCTCPPGQEIVGEQCVDLCGNNEMRNAAGECVCEPNFYLSGDECTACPSGAFSPAASTDLSQCVCPSDTEMVDMGRKYKKVGQGVCYSSFDKELYVDTIAGCASACSDYTGFSFYGWNCYCYTDSYSSNCEKTHESDYSWYEFYDSQACLTKCKANEVRNGAGECVCKANEVRNTAGECVCKPDEIRNAAGECVCKPNFYMSDGVCALCPSKSTSPAGSTECTCPSETEMIDVECTSREIRHSDACYAHSRQIYQTNSNCFSACSGYDGYLRDFDSCQCVTKSNSDCITVESIAGGDFLTIYECKACVAKCEDNEVLNAVGECVCKIGYHRSPQTFKCERNVCSCDFGTHAIGENCENHGDARCTECSHHRVLSADGLCDTCDVGYVKSDWGCSLKICPMNMRVDEFGDCACADNFKLVDSVCVPECQGEGKFMVEGQCKTAEEILETAGDLEMAEAVAVVTKKLFGEEAESKLLCVNYY